MFSPLYMIGLVGFAHLVHGGAAPRGYRQSGTPPFDGQYLAANASNMVVEWWYAQALAEPAGDNPPVNAVAVFTQGALLGTEPANETGDAEYYIMLSGTFPNGTNFFYELPATSAEVTTSGQAVNGSWPGAGSFTLNSDLTVFLAQIDAPAYGINGSISLTSNGNYHYPRGSTPDPYFNSAAPAGVTLSPYEQIVFDQFGWAITVTGGTAAVSLNVEGTELRFTGNAYHDHNFMPTAINEFFEMWYWVQAQVGPYDLTGMLLEPLNSSYAVVSGYLYDTRAGVLQDQCSLNETKTAADTAAIVPWGAVTDAGTGALVPAGFVVDFTLASGARYSFNLTAIATNPDLAEYYRWAGTATGGEVGGEQFNGTALFEWMNPSLSVYSP